LFNPQAGEIEMCRVFTIFYNSSRAQLAAPVRLWAKGLLTLRIDWEVGVPKTAFQINLKKSPESAAIKTHNRSHPDIPEVNNNTG